MITDNKIAYRSALIFSISFLSCFAEVAESTSTSVRLKVNADRVLRETDRFRLLGTNLALWTDEKLLNDSRFRDGVLSWSPGIIRMPGGSWSNEYYWNGNGVRLGNGHSPDNFDPRKQRENGTWDIDFTDYAPGFRVHGEARELADYHGSIDVKAQHEFIHSLAPHAMVTVNVGSGSPELAAKWVQWANGTEGYGVRYWEIGNELNGDWEMGHRLSDGSSMNGETYAQLFRDYSAIMRKADPSIRLGGPACSDLSLAFVEKLIEGAGEDLDFISVHAYPVGVSTVENSKKFISARQIEDAVKKIESWISQYQPGRTEEIEIGVTEWNIKVNEDIDTAHLLNGLWSALWIGNLFSAGVDFANQWDLVTQTEEGGHSAFFHKGNQLKRKSQYWALWMWSQLMADTLVESEVEGDDALECFVTRSDAGIQLMLINTSENAEIQLDLEFSGPHRPHYRGSLHRFSAAEYFWDPHAREPKWSHQPTVFPLDFSQNRILSIPKYSICVVRLPWRSDQVSEIKEPAQLKEGKLELLLPDELAMDRSIEGWVVAYDPSEEAPDLSTPTKIQLEVEGPAELVDAEITLESGTAPFLLKPSGPGKITVRASNGVHRIERAIDSVKRAERMEIFWKFDNPIDQWNAKSTFALGFETSILPNQPVAKTTLDNEIPAKDADVLFHFEPLPSDLPFDKIIGVLGKLKASHDLECGDPDARIKVILQSDANHWMQILTTPLSGIIGRWETIRLKIDDVALRDALKKLYSIRFQIISDTPVTGDIYLDDLGFILEE